MAISFPRWETYKGPYHRICMNLTPNSISCFKWFRFLLFKPTHEFFSNLGKDEIVVKLMTLRSNLFQQKLKKFQNPKCIFAFQFWYMESLVLEHQYTL